ncbi:MAG: alpha/beta hydrolase [Candidatus Bathyarchaeota archaeon]|nr:alpha/beta hydrolase [Candidatus Bathyarchaeota archaeon]
MNEKTLKAAGYQCKALISQGTGVPVVFLHGFSYTSDIWQRISVTQLLEEKKVPFMALDMPYGSKSDCTPKTHDPEANVAVAKEAIESVFNSEVPVLVGASLGGNIALRYAERFPVRGLLLTAPACALEQSLLQAYSNWSFPVRVIWGSEDNIISGEEMRTLAQKLPNGKLVTYEGADHSAYKNDPDRFKRDLFELYVAAEQM